MPLGALNLATVEQPRGAVCVPVTTGALALEGGTREVDSIDAAVRRGSASGDRDG